MTIFEIKTDNFEFRFGTYKNSIPSMTEQEVFDTYLGESCNDPTIRESFDTLEEAREEFSKNYSFYGSTYPEAGNVFWLLRGDLAWIEENEYDDDGEFISGSNVWEYSAQGYDGVEK